MTLVSSLPRAMMALDASVNTAGQTENVVSNAVGTVRQFVLVQRTDLTSTAWAYEFEGTMAPGVIIPMSSDYRFDLLFNAIRSLATDPDLQLEGEAVDERTARDASAALALIENYDIRPPQIFSHRGRAIVFSWDLPKVSRYLTVSHGKVSVLDIDRQTRIRCKYPPSQIESSEIGGFFKALAVPHAAIHSS